MSHQINEIMTRAIIITVVSLILLFCYIFGSKATEITDAKYLFWNGKYNESLIRFNDIIENDKKNYDQAKLHRGIMYSDQFVEFYDPVKAYNDFNDLVQEGNLYAAIQIFDWKYWIKDREEIFKIEGFQETYEESVALIRAAARKGNPSAVYRLSIECIFLDMECSESEKRMSVGDFNDSISHYVGAMRATSYFFRHLGPEKNGGLHNESEVNIHPHLEIFSSYADPFLSFVNYLILNKSGIDYCDEYKYITRYNLYLVYANYVLTPVKELWRKIERHGGTCDFSQESIKNVVNDLTEYVKILGIMYVFNPTKDIRFFQGGDSLCYDKKKSKDVVLCRVTGYVDHYFRCARTILPSVPLKNDYPVVISKFDFSRIYSRPRYQECREFFLDKTRMIVEGGAGAD